jgi:hypothetical protein
MIGVKKKEDKLPWAIQEEEQEYSKLSATISSSLSALEQAQARLRQDLPVTKNPLMTTPTAAKWSLPSPSSPPPPPPPVQTQPVTTPLTSSFGQFLAPPPGQDNNTDDDQSDTSSNREKPLTGLARRRKRSSAARALKDKLAAETVDFELMKGNKKNRIMGHISLLETNYSIKKK